METPGAAGQEHSPEPPGARDWSFQDRVLPGVSRTFALTIPELPEGIRPVVANGYLLCRIADTIEDEPALALEQKQAFHREFAQVVAGDGDAASFARRLAPLLSQRTSDAERELVQGTESVVRICRSFAARPRAALVRCVRIMCEGMPQFQSKAKGRPGLEDRSFDLAGPESLSQREFIARAARLYDGSPRVVPVPVGLVRALAFAAEKFLAEPPMTRDMLGVLLHDDRVDPEPVCKELGIELTPLDETLRRSVGPEASG